MYLVVCASNGHPMRNLYLEGIGTLTALVVDSHSALFSPLGADKNTWQILAVKVPSWHCVRCS